MPQQISALLTFRLTPTLSLAPYTSGDQISTLQTFPKATFGTLDRAVTLKSFSIVNFANLALRFRLHLFGETPTGLPADNAPFSVPAPEARAKWLGYHEISPADYGTASFGGTRKIATFAAVELDCLSSSLNTLQQRSNDLYLLLEALEPATFVATDDLLLVFNFQN